MGCSQATAETGWGREVALAGPGVGSAAAAWLLRP